MLRCNCNIRPLLHIESPDSNLDLSPVLILMIFVTFGAFDRVVTRIVHLTDMTFEYGAVLLVMAMSSAFEAAEVLIWGEPF